VIRLLFAIAIAILAALRTADADCQVVPDSRTVVDGIDLSTGQLTALPIAQLGPIEVFYNQCATANAGVTFGTAGVYSNADSFLRIHPDNGLTVVTPTGETHYPPSTGRQRRLPDDGTYFERAPDRFTLKSSTSRDELVYGRVGNRFLLTEVHRTTGDAANPFSYAFIYERDATGALTGIRQTNSGDRIAITRAGDRIFAEYFLANRSGPADWFAIERRSGRLALVDVPAPDGVAHIEYTLSDAGRIIEIRHPSGATTRYLYDAGGRVTETLVFETDAIGTSLLSHTRYSYQVENTGLTTAIQRDGDGSGEATRFAFGPSGLLLRVEVGGAVLSIFTYDGLRRLSRVSHPADGTSLSYLYRGVSELVTQAIRQDGATVYAAQADVTGQLPVSVTVDGVGPTTIEYDALSRVASVVAPDGRRQTNTVHATERPSLVEACTIDETARSRECTLMDLARGGAVIERRSGHLGMPGTDRVEHFDLDPSELVIRATSRVGAITTDERIFEGHDDRGMPATVYHTDFVMGGPTQIDTYARNADGSVATRSDEEGYAARFTYDAVGQLRKATLDRGRAEPLATVDVGKRADCMSAASLSVNGAPVVSTTTGGPSTIPIAPSTDGPPVNGQLPGMPALPANPPPGSYPPGNPPVNQMPQPGMPNLGAGYMPPNPHWYMPHPNIFWPIYLTSDPAQPDSCGITHYVCHPPALPESPDGYTRPPPSSVMVYCKESNIFEFPHGSPQVGSYWADMAAVEIPNACGDGRSICRALGRPGEWLDGPTTMGQCLGTTWTLEVEPGVDLRPRVLGPDGEIIGPPPIGGPSIEDILRNIGLPPPPPDDCIDGDVVFNAETQTCEVAK
jgi:YD repeat-containing protein